MLNIICWKWNVGSHVKKKIIYSAKHVNVLYKSCLKFIDIPFKFTCITDNTKGLYKGIETVPVWNDYEKYGWCYRRLKTFSKEMIPVLGERILSIDLDCIIMKNITSLIDNNEDFMIWKSKTSRAPFSGSMWMMNIGVYQDIWDDFREEDLIQTGHRHYKYQNKYAVKAGFNVGSDQSWINYKLSNKNFKCWTEEDGIYNFRKIFNKNSQSYNKLNKAKIIFFSGSSDPSQKNIQEKYSWIKKYWTLSNKKFKSMKEMSIITVQFDYRNDWYGRLLRAFRNSVNLQMPDIGLTEYTYSWNQSNVSSANRSASLECNTFKLERWLEILENSDEKICFTDCDMLMTNRIDDVWKKDFDVACTYRQRWKKIGGGIPYNGGVIFVRPNKRSISFFKKWVEVNREMINNPSFHSTWRKKYAGVNQAAFGYILETYPDICKMAELPCPIWNSVDESWRTFNEETKMVHIKSKLRKYCLGSQKVPRAFKYLVDLWRWHETLDENKDILLKESLDNNEEYKIRRPTEMFPLSIIVPKLNDPHQEKKFDLSIHMEDELIILKSTKQNYRKTIEKAMYDNILIINPNNYALLNNPENIDAFRFNSKFIINNKNSVIRSSIKVLKEDALNCIKSEKITFRTLLNLMSKYYEGNEQEIAQLENIFIPFKWKEYIERDKIVHYYNTTHNNEQFYVEYKD